MTILKKIDEIISESLRKADAPKVPGFTFDIGEPGGSYWSVEKQYKQGNYLYGEFDNGDYSMALINGDTGREILNVSGSYKNNADIKKIVLDFDRKIQRHPSQRG